MKKRKSAKSYQYKPLKEGEWKDKFLNQNEALKVANELRRKRKQPIFSAEAFKFQFAKLDFDDDE